MIEHSHEEQFFRRYLLGEVTEEERERLQESYFVDAGLFSRLLSAEADLIDASERGELTAEEREHFEQRFGHLRGIDQRLNFASLLSRAADQHAISTPAGLPDRGTRSSIASAPPPGFPWLSSISPSLSSRIVRASVVAIAAVIVVMAALVAANRWSAGRQGEPGADLARSQTETPNTQPATPATPGPIQLDNKGMTAGAPPTTTATENPRPPLPKAQMASVSVVLHGGMTREGGPATPLVLSPTTRSLQVQLGLPADLQTRTYSSYVVMLQKVSGQEVIRRGSLKISKGRGGSFVSLSIPVELLTTRDYVVLLNGQRSDGTQQYLRGYFLSILKK